MLGILNAYSQTSVFDSVIAIAKWRRYKSVGIGQTVAELNHAVGEKLRSQIHKLTASFWNKEHVPFQCKESVIIPAYQKVMKGIVVTTEARHCYQIHIKFIQHCSVKVNSIQAKGF
jgi:hypothetical protein